MEIHHHHLGVISYNEDDVVTFPLGLLGFLKLKRYLMQQNAASAPFQRSEEHRLNSSH